MGKVNRFLMMLIAMGAIMIAAVGIDRGIKLYNTRKWEAELHERYEQARADVASIEMTISQISNDPEALEAFIEENREYFDEMLENMGDFEGEYISKIPGQSESFPGAESEEPGSTEPGEGFDVEDMEGENTDVSGNEISENQLWDVSGNKVGDISGNGFYDVSGNRIFDVSGNRLMSVSGNTVSGNSISGNAIQKDAFPGGGTSENGGSTLLEKRKIRGSYIETRKQNGIDKKAISENDVDFSEISIACLGDSITEAANLSDMENYQQYSYPTKLKDLLGAESVVNLGIGGSSIGRYWDQAFVDRYQEIPEDTDLILVMGGTNDGFCLSENELGTMEERKERTYIGDLDELMRSLKRDYPDATIVFATPLPNVLHDILRKERDYLLPQSLLVNIMKQLAAEYEIPVIDLYNSNILDTHDAAVIYNYMPDGVHCNFDGYTLLAEHMAAEVIRLYEMDENEAGDERTPVPEKVNDSRTDF
ncbi:MAG: SGNH/GDSL hydrolase family protein [Lachnospiraceae bacterium]|nr:SGNH/GDSL hydrolase family protein [Lachnospiraceae bacterium]